MPDPQRTAAPTRDDVTIVVVTYNSAHCLPALAASLAGMPHICVVDNGSRDETPERVRALLPKAILLENGANLGFGAANNRALAACATHYALLLNPDCQLDPAAVDRLLAVAHQFPDAALVAPHLLRRHGALELSYRWPSTRWRSAGAAADGPCCVGFVSGAAMLLNLTAMRAIGLFDETFFLYYEDEDLCQRIFNARRQIIVAPDAQVTHVSRGSVRGSSPLRSEFLRGYHHAQSKLIFENKHVGPDQAAALRWRTLALALLTLLPRLLVPQPRYLARLLGRIAGLCRAYPRGTRPIR